MKRKSDFVTNSSSTSYIVIETWEIISGDIKIYKDDARIESANITKQFIDFVLALEPDNNYMTNFSIAVNDEHLQLAFGEDIEGGDVTEISLSLGKGEGILNLWEINFTLNAYNDRSVECSFHYKSASGSKDLDKAIDLMVTAFIKMLGITKQVDVEIDRRIFEFTGDGWDGGDPWCGYYGDSNKCREEVECKRILTVNKEKI